MITSLEKDIVRILQEGLPLESRPFQSMAKRLGITEDTLIETIREMHSRGLIRRFGAAVRHQDLGYTANAMVVWKVDGEEAVRAGGIFSTFAEVTHCYQRENSGDWQHNLFTMVHGKSSEECHRIARELSKASGLTEYLVLFSTEELKKVSMKYFTEG